MLRASVRRLSQAELAARISTAPSFVADRVPDEALDRICAEYTAITGIRITTRKKRAFVASTYRTLGADFLPAVRARCAETGSEENLLADLRAGAARQLTPSYPQPVAAPWEARARGATSQDAHRPGEPQHVDGTVDCGCPEADLLPALIYCVAHYPRFRATSTRRHDRRPSNADAARFFSDRLSRSAPEAAGP